MALRNYYRLPGLVLCALLVSAQDDCNEPSSYVITIVARNSQLPVPNVPVWLGKDGQGPLAHTDAFGQVQFDVSSPIQDLSFAYITGATQDNRFASFLSLDISQEPTFTIGMSELYGEATNELQGLVSGIQPNTEDTLRIETSSTLQFQEEISSEEYAYNLSSYTSEHGFLYAGQATSSYTIPHHFGLMLDPTGQQDIILDQVPDQTVYMELSNVDRAINETWHYYYLNPDSGPPIYLDKGRVRLDGSDANSVAVPTLSEQLPISSLTMAPWIWDSRGNVFQEAVIHDVYPSDTILVSLPTVHDIDLPDHVSVEQLPGLEIPMRAPGSDHLTFSLLHTYRDEDGNVFRASWYVSQNQASDNLYVPEVPPGAIPWPDQRITEGNASLVGNTVLSLALFSSSDEDPDYQTSGVDVSENFGQQDKSAFSPEEIRLTARAPWVTMR